MVEVAELAEQEDQRMRMEAERGQWQTGRIALLSARAAMVEQAMKLLQVLQLRPYLLRPLLP